MVNLDEGLASLSQLELVSMGPLVAEPHCLEIHSRAAESRRNLLGQSDEFFILQNFGSQSELDCIPKELNDEFRDNNLPTDTDMRCTPGDLCIAK